MVTQNACNEYITPNASQEVLSPSQPCFCATSSGHADVTGDNTAYQVVFETERFDQNADYASGTGLFTAPVTGRYLFCEGLEFYTPSSSGTQEFLGYMVTSNETYRIFNLPTRERVTNYKGESSGIAFSGSCECDMDAADTCFIQWRAGTGTKTADLRDSYFSGKLIF